MSKPLVNDKRFREELERLEREGMTVEPEEIAPSDGIYPPASGKRIELRPIMLQAEVDKLQAKVRAAGIELINDGACYRAKRQRDFMIWTLETSPLVPEEMGGGESNALWEVVTRFCVEKTRKS